MPVMVTDLLASPRRAKPGPDTMGVTATTSGVRSTCVADLLPLVDGAQSLRPRLHLRRHLGARLGCAQRARHLVGRQDDDRRLVVERAAHDVGLQPREQRRHEHDHAAAEPDAEDDEQRLHQAFAHEAEGDDQLEECEAVHGCAAARDGAHALSASDHRLGGGNQAIARRHALQHLDAAVAPSGRA